MDAVNSKEVTKHVGMLYVRLNLPTALSSPVCGLPCFLLVCGLWRLCTGLVLCYLNFCYGGYFLPLLAYHRSQFCIMPKALFFRSLGCVLLI